VRAFNAVGGNPIYVVSGKGARIRTADNAELVDFCGSWGPLILGHARPEVVEAVSRAASEGTTFGINTPREVEFAELLCELAPSLEMVRVMSSGTEATMTALRLARGFTGRRKIVKFDGCYHGHADYLLVAAGSGLLTGGISSSAGVSPAAAAEVLVPAYNDLAAVESVVREQGDQIAAIIVEPVAGNMGLVPPAPGFLQGLRDAATRCGALLIFDEVITGFRFGPTTYGKLCGVTPDLTCLGKIIGGGMPIGAVGGRADVMRSLAPLGPVYQAGTLSGNPVAVAAGLTMLKLLKKENPYPALDALGRQLADGLNAIAREDGLRMARCQSRDAHGQRIPAEAGTPTLHSSVAGHDGAGVVGVPPSGGPLPATAPLLRMHCARLGGVFTPYFCANPVNSLAGAKQCDTKAHAAFFHGVLERGFYLPPSQFEVGFISAAHTAADIDAFLSAARRGIA
jgi:glutamate-1-semialdehyde 2,1-aminomutase